MDKLREFCWLNRNQSRLLGGAYVRSKNYVDKVSDKSVLMGFAGDLSIFKLSALPVTSKMNATVPLEPLWRYNNRSWYIDVDNGIDNIACSLEDYPCMSITYALTLYPVYYEDYTPDVDTATLWLTKNDSIETVIDISPSTILGRKITIDSKNTALAGAPTTKYGLITNHQADTIFTVHGDDAVLTLKHILLENNKPDSANPLFSVYHNDVLHTPELILIDCELLQNPVPSDLLVP